MKILNKRFLGIRLKYWLWVLVIVPGVPFVAGSLFIIAYSNLPWPMDDTVQLGPLKDDTEGLVVLIHGKGDDPSSWADSFAEELESSILDEHQQAVTIDWERYSNDLFRSTLNARRLGHDLGKKLAEYSNIKRLHLIGHSAGSFVVYGMCEAVKKNRKNIFVHATYLDPVSIYGGIDWEYGTRNFGSCADISDAYIDRDDGVPGSNGPLRHPHTFDVTALKGAAGFSGPPHLWPVIYYRRAVLGKKLPYWEPDPTTLWKYPAGKYSVIRGG